MRPGSGKQKGSAFERLICKELSLWISSSARADIFWRSAMSGGRATVAAKQGIILKAQAGDISPITALGEALLNLFVVECKHYQNLDVFSGIVNETGSLYKFWMTVKAQAEVFDKHAMLIGKQNNMPTIVLLDDMSLPVLSLTQDNVLAHLPRWGACLLLFDCFLREAQVPAVSIVKTARRRVRLA